MKRVNRILYISDVGDYAHSTRWITYLSSAGSVQAYFTCLEKEHTKLSNSLIDKFHSAGVILISPISPFSILYFWRTMRSLMALKAIVKKYEIDIIHIMYADPNALWGIFKSYFGCRMILTTRGTDVLVYLQSLMKGGGLVKYMLKKLYKIALHRFDIITSTSSKQIDIIKSIVKQGQRICIIRTGIEVFSFNDDESVLKSVGTESFVLMPRSMKPIYNHEFTIEAIAELPKEILSKYSFVFVNCDGSDKKYIGRIYSRLSELKHVKSVLLPTLSKIEMYTLLKRAALVIMNPLSDGSPVSAMEAMFFKRPIILGPLEYDNSLFNHSAIIRLREWSLNELKTHMIDILNNGMKTEALDDVSELVKKHAIFEVEMSKILKFYNEIIRH